MSLELRPGTKAIRMVVALILLAGVVTTAWWLREGRPGSRAPVKVGVRNFPPFYFVTPGKPVRGVAVEVVGEAARRLKIPVEWVTIREASDAALTRGAIDIWPSMTLSTERQTPVYVTDPWMHSDYFLLFRPESLFESGREVTGRVIAFVPSRVGMRLATEFLGGARLVERMTPAEALQSVCREEAQAAFLEAREGQALLMKRPDGCERTAFSFARVPGARIEIGIASRPGQAGLADELRAEIDRMSEDRTLSDIVGRWSFATASETSAVYLLHEARRRTRYLVYGVTLLAAALAFTLWQNRRVRVARRTAEQASRSLEAYARQQARYRVLFERSLAGVFRSTTGGRVLECNEALARMFGCDSPDQMRDMPLSADAFTGRDWPHRLQEFRDQKATRSFDLKIRRKDGSEGVVIANVTFVEGKGKEPDALEGTIIDVTRERELEQQYRQAQKLESIGRLAGGIAHDFNNLLTAINGYSELALGQIEPQSPLREFVEEISKAGARAASLTQQLLAFSRKQLLQPEILNLNKVVEDIEKMLRRLIGEDVDLVTTLDPALGCVKADRGQIQQVIMNLAVNARDAMPGGGRLEIQTRNVEVSKGTHAGSPEIPAGSWVELMLQDSGHGMDAATLAHLFEPFFTTKVRGKGTGLGLSTVYGIVRQSDGHIRAESEPGKGARFVISLPRLSGAQTGEPPISRPLRVLTTGTILLAEDQEEVRTLVFRVLSQLGYRVLAGSDGAEALQLLKNCAERVDLLISDVVMPGMTGRELAEKVHESSPMTRVLFMSGYTDDILLSQGLDHEQATYLQKPFGASQLAERVREILTK
jgi:PAS domain S-box-containing protein